MASFNLISGKKCLLKVVYSFVLIFVAYIFTSTSYLSENCLIEISSCSSKLSINVISAPLSNRELLVFILERSYFINRDMSMLIIHDKIRVGESPDIYKTPINDPMEQP